MATLKKRKPKPKAKPKSARARMISEVMTILAKRSICKRRKDPAAFKAQLDRARDARWHPERKGQIALPLEEAS